MSACATGPTIEEPSDWPAAREERIEGFENWDCEPIAGGELPYACQSVCAGPEDPIYRTGL